MCGPSNQEKALQSSSQSFSSQLQQNYGQLFGQQQDVLSAINRSLSPTLAAGPSQNGFSGAELSALQTQAINNAGAANTAAQQAARTFGAGEGGGATSGLTSGITKQIQSAIGSQAANALGGQQTQINLANEQQGNANYWRAAGGMNALAEGYSPNSAQGGAISENQNSFGQASQITKENNAEDEAIAGGLTSLAGAGLGMANGSDFLGGIGGGKIFGPGSVLGGG